ncbi:MAG: hypothetical protein A3C03_02120 [Candidatus Colwellbacteria bacterium RIFCSPHIGHO2_02_FULL_45_17]|uniref:Ribose-5-phosphate isomerase n=2 Tax=Candidatus Colwelliibacteriota TaxID=1817904 RepID=A0A1G1ZFN4_9BACT|nr:MAG: hypothetical protein A3C03_02120 [Candidatus Colwellbacteria bacterium RIFCSPHIGHO2_02_FULL_45_17]OGY60865.1 MAG: hypothetical protein A3I33_01545 [Candidatus Colwellbacteria bacterium RIFCSPLOWO2_02_FULL_45_11]OGY62637.1 MAG: hypothetical protein A3G58_00920 [Candidatus Colwellbacteria bacterium RIFCSPLOWO2_12_FULL_46_17]
MILYIGADHRGFELKEALKGFLEESGYTVDDMGATAYNKDDDFVDFAKYVAEKVNADTVNSRGILICANGVGMDMAANKFPQVRSVLAMSPDHALTARVDDDTNILSIAADFTDFDTAKKIVSVWLQTPFSGEERYKRRIEKLRDLGNSVH